VLFGAFSCLTKQEKHFARISDGMLFENGPCFTIGACGAFFRLFPLFSLVQAEKAEFQFS